MALACVYMHTQQVGFSSAKITGKEELETVFRLFWNNINQQMMDYQKSNKKENNSRIAVIQIPNT